MCGKRREGRGRGEGVSKNQCISQMHCSDLTHNSGDIIFKSGV